MEKFDVHILGCGSAMPTTLHFPASQVVNVRDKLFMIDCGEGAQIQYRRCKLKFTRLNHIFISHLHGDHCFGLPGLLSSLGLAGRTAEMVIHSPKGLEEAMAPLLEAFCKGLPYPLTFRPFETEESALIYEDRSLAVSTIPLQHRVPCCGFLFAEKPLLNHLRRDMIDFYHIPVAWMNRIKQGEDYVTPEGEVVANSRLTFPARPARRYAYCSDTMYTESFLEQIRGIDLLYHEATFADAEQVQSVNRFHSTARQAAELARKAEVKRLILGHYSARYPDLSVLEEEARSVFPETFLSGEGKIFSL